MSTLKADTIVASDGSSPVTLTAQEAAKVTVDCTAAGVVNDSSNVSSAVDGSTGQTTINLSTALASALQPAIGGIHDSGSNRSINVGNVSASSFLIYTFTSSTGAVSDSVTDFSVAAFGDLA